MNRKKVVLFVFLSALFAVSGIHLSCRTLSPLNTPQVSSTIHTIQGWSPPVRIAASDKNWEDSLFVTADGNTIYFTYYPDVDLLTPLLITKTPLAGDLNIYKSEKPFVTKMLDRRYALSSPIYSAAGPMVTKNQEIFYHSNHTGQWTHKYDDDIYLNDQRLPFNTSESFTNPHYCAAKDELWFDKSDQDIFILSNAKQDQFTGKPVPAPTPINSPASKVQDSQPWLSEDGQTLYFTSNRADPQKGSAIYQSQRLKDGSWSEPKLVIWSAIAVGEPTLTEDGRRLFFIQISRNGAGQFTSDMYYTEKI